MQADLALKFLTGISKYAGDWHENDGKKHGQSQNEEYMDRLNNAQGREIAKEIEKEVDNFVLLKMYAHSGKLDDLIAKKVMERMKAGKLITHPSDKRKYTGFAANIEENADLPQGKVFTAEEIGNLSTDDFQKFEKYIDKQLKEFGVPREYQAKDMASKGDLIWVDDYKRDDGTPVKGYYRRK